MKTFILIIFFYPLYSCNSNIKHKKKKINEINNKKTDTIKFSLLKHNLYVDNFGNIGFKTMDNSDPQKPVDRYLTFVWNADPDEDNGGKMEMKDVIDTTSFKEIKGIYYQDKNHFYVFNQMSDGGTFAILQRIDSKTFIVLSPYYAKDINHIYYGSEVIQNVDVKTFKPFPKISNNDTLWQYGRDKNHFFYFGNVIKPEELKLHSLQKF